MKKIFLGLLLMSGIAAFGQSYPYNGYKAQQYPVYYPYNTSNSYMTTSYDSISTPSNDTIRATLNGATDAYHLVVVTHNIILLFDTTGDTLQHATVWGNKTWYKKTPFAGTSSPAHQLDKLHYIFESGSTSSNYKVTVPWFNNGLAGDTIHVPVKTTSGGGSFVNGTYIYQKNAVVWTPYTTW